MPRESLAECGRIPIQAAAAMHRFVITLALSLLASCASYNPPEAPERWLTRHQTEHHYHESELAPQRRFREVPERMRGHAVASLHREHFSRLSDEEARRYGVESLERLPGQFVYLLRAVRPADRPYNLEVHRDHLVHRGHTHPPETVTTLARTTGPAYPPLEKTAVVYVDSRPPEKLNVDYMLRR